MPTLHLEVLAIGLLLKQHPLYVSIPIVMLSSLGILILTEKARLYGDAAIGIVSSLGIACGILQASAAGGFNVDLFKQKVADSLARLFTVFFWFSLLGSLVVGYFMVHFFPNYTYDAITTIENHPWKTLGTGFLVVLLTPALIILVLVTLIGLPLGFILTVFYGVDPSGSRTR